MDLIIFDGIDEGSFNKVFALQYLIQATACVKDIIITKIMRVRNVLMKTAPSVLERTDL